MFHQKLVAVLFSISVANAERITSTLSRKQKSIFSKFVASANFRVNAEQDYIRQ
jgi:hypothetical protein